MVPAIQIHHTPHARATESCRCIILDATDQPTMPRKKHCRGVHTLCGSKDSPKGIYSRADIGSYTKGRSLPVSTESVEF